MKSHVMTSPFHLIGRGILRGSVYCKPGKYYQRSCLKIKLGITNNIILQLNTCVWLLPSPEYQIQELMWVGSPWFPNLCLLYLALYREHLAWHREFLFSHPIQSHLLLPSTVHSPNSNLWKKSQGPNLGSMTIDRFFSTQIHHSASRRVETDKDPKANIVKFPILSFISFSASKFFSIAFFLLPRSYYHYWMEC